MMPDAVLDLVEPAAKAFAADNPGDELVALASLAISARRIADAIVGDPSNLGLVPAIAVAIEQGILAARR